MVTEKVIQVRPLHNMDGDHLVAGQDQMLSLGNTL